MLARVGFTGLKVETYIGIHAHEKLSPQPLHIDLTCLCSIENASSSDSIEDVPVNYAACAETCLCFASENHFLLLESFTTALARTLFHRHQIEGLKLRVAKPQALESAEEAFVEVTLP